MKTLIRFKQSLAIIFTVLSMAYAADVLAQAGNAQDAIDDNTVLSEVLAALPPGVTLETATDDQIALAVQTVTTSRGNAVAAQVLGVVSVTLDSIGRSDSAGNVTTNVVNSLPANQRNQVQQQVAASRANPSPSQVAATSVVLSQIQPATGQQQQQQPVVNVPVVQPQNQGGAFTDASGNVQPATNQQQTNNAQQNVVNTVSQADPNAFDSTTKKKVSDN